MAVAQKHRFTRIKRIVRWISARKDAIEAVAKTLSIVGAAVVFIFSQISQHQDQEYKKKQATFNYLLEKYNKIVDDRAEIARSEYFIDFFKKSEEIPKDKIYLLIKSDEKEMANLRLKVIKYVNQNETMALARNHGIYSGYVFDSQLKSILELDFKIFKYFILQTEGEKGAGYREWKKLIKTWNSDEYKRAAAKDDTE